MKLRSIWSMPSYSLAERLRRTRDWLAMAIAARLPRRIRYWTTVLEMAKASTVDPTQVVPEMTIMDIMSRLDRPKVVT